MDDESSKFNLKLPYQNRQIIVVANDALVESTRRRKDQASKVTQSLEVVESLTTLTDHIVPGVKLGLILTKRAVDAYAGWTQARAGGLTVFQISRSDAQEIQFPVGHPRDGVVYVGHPSVPNVYYPMADFHKAMFEHKLCEAVRLLMNLGATKIEVEHINGWDETFSVNLAVPLASTGTIGGHGGGHSKGQTRLLYRAELSGTTNPTIPVDMVWYNHEPTWQVISEGRTKHGLEQFSIDLKYVDDFGVSAGLAAKIEKSGLDVGGKFQDHQSTHWRIKGHFRKADSRPPHGSTRRPSQTFKEAVRSPSSPISTPRTKAVPRSKTTEQTNRKRPARRGDSA